MYLYDAVIETAKALQIAHAGTATGGTTSQLQDTALPFRASWFDAGTLIMQAGGLTGLLIGITTSTTTAINFAAQASAPAAGNKYTAIRGLYTLQALKDAINDALLEMSLITQLDETLTVVDGQEEYTLPDGVQNICRVETTTETAAPYGWGRSFYWHEHAGKLIFDSGHLPSTADTQIRLWYNAPHAAVSVYNDIISPYVNPSRLAWAAAFSAASARARLTQNDERMKEFLTLAQSMKLQLAVRFPIYPMSKDPRLAAY